MSLSARIVVGPSLRLASATATLAVGGIVATAATAVARWPDATMVAAIAGALASLAVVGRTVVVQRASVRCIVSVSARAEVDVRVDSQDHRRTDLDGPWRLSAPTMSWGGSGGFSVVGLARRDEAERPRVARLPILHADLTTADARALGRFLRWSLRGGAADPTRASAHRID